MVGDRGAAEDLRQEAFARAWKSAPRDADRDHLRAWVHRTARNLAVDQLRRRRSATGCRSTTSTLAVDAGPRSRRAARRARGARPADPARAAAPPAALRGRAVAAEIGGLLDISEEAARKRVARARAALRARRRDGHPARAPARAGAGCADDCTRPTSDWIAAAGGEARVLDRERFEREIASADALVVSGSQTDIDPRLYGQRERRGRGRPRPASATAATWPRCARAGPGRAVRRRLPRPPAAEHRVRRDAAPGHRRDARPGDRYDIFEHPIGTASRSVARRVLGRGIEVCQRAPPVGRPRRPRPARDVDVERRRGRVARDARRSFAIGVQWHPEDREAAGRGRRGAARRRGSSARQLHEATGDATASPRRRSTRSSRRDAGADRRPGAPAPLDVDSPRPLTPASALRGASSTGRSCRGDVAPTDGRPARARDAVRRTASSSRCRQLPRRSVELAALRDTSRRWRDAHVDAQLRAAELATLELVLRG